MTKENDGCICLHHADKIVYEIKGIAHGVTNESMKEDGDYIQGMLLVFQESGLAATFNEFADLDKAQKTHDLELFRKSAFSAANKIEATDCYKVMK